MLVEIIAQAAGIIAMIFVIISYQSKTQNGIIGLQFFSSAFFTLQFFLMKAYAGALSNMIAVFRAVVYKNKQRTKADHILWLYVFIWRPFCRTYSRLPCLISRLRQRTL